jgi:alpha-glucosidase
MTARSEIPNAARWWQRGVIYEIYVRSFCDSNGDGIGDLPGITSRLDYLRELGIAAFWLTPFYPSPMADGGYDVACYTDVDPRYGTLADFDELVREAHRRELHVILDLVPNHTSDEHPWFLASRSVRTHPQRDWYIWRDPAPGGGPPNNWLSVFGGSAWEWDEASGQYYYHAFDRKQPDLNWRNPAVEAAMLDAMSFWLERGADGFRVDVLWHLIKDARLRDNPPNPGYVHGQPGYQRLLPVYSTDQTQVHGIVSKLRALVDRYADRVLIGEIYLPIEELVRYYGNQRGAHLPLNFQLIAVPWAAAPLAAAIDKYEGSLGERDWPNWVLGNHDQPRVASRIGAEQARVAALLLLSLRGTPTLYYGDELGMYNGSISGAQSRDPQERNEPGQGFGRDPERTPMRWDESPGAGFTRGEPWLPFADPPSANVSAQRADPRSMLSLYRQLLELRQRTPALHSGLYRPLWSHHDNTLGFLRESGAERYLIALNLSGEPRSCVPERLPLQGRLLLSTHLDRAGEALSGRLELRSHEAVIARLGEP